MPQGIALFSAYRQIVITIVRTGYRNPLPVCRGKRRMIFVPSPSRDSTFMLPSLATTIAFAMLMPSPAPSVASSVFVPR